MVYCLAMLLFDVDTQIDFLVPEGRLYVAHSESIRPKLQMLTTWAGEQGVPTISTACAHQPNDSELQMYGQHCMVGTPGQQKVPETLLPNRVVVPNRPITLGDLRTFQQVIIEKQEFDFATNPNSRQALQQFGEALEIVLCGVVTEICVAAAARSLFDWGHKVSVVWDAVAGLDSTKAKAFADELIGRGGTLVTAGVVTQSPRRAAL
jgi:nicotinamidase/pyrazinamidase